MKTKFTEDLENNQLVAERTFKSPVNAVWKAWTDPKLLCQWWAPLPYLCKIESMDFKVGGYWQYVMVGPEGDEHRGRMDYLKIDELKLIEGEDYFCDEDGNASPDIAPMNMLVTFKSEGDATLVTTVTTFANSETMKQMAEMGMVEGWDLALNQLEGLL